MGGVLIRRRTRDKRRERLMPKFILEREQRIDIERRKMEFKNSGKIGYVGGPKGPRTGQRKICEEGKDRYIPQCLGHESLVT